MSLWTEVQIAKLKELVAQNAMSFSKMAALIGQTRNAVIGKAHRLGMCKKSPESTMKESHNKSSKEKVKMTKRELPPPMAVTERFREAVFKIDNADSSAVTIMKLQPYHCRWPLGESPDVRYCGKDIAINRYCVQHAHIAYPKMDNAFPRR